MHLIKLNAIDSTNDYLKAFAAGENVANFTVVTAETQTRGRGQMGAKWISEPGKNLTMSVLIKEVLADINQIFSLNVAVALSIVDALKNLNIPKLSVKWPNDIMSDNKKIGGILIENTVKTNGGIVSIVGIGLNVNQTDFAALPKASSLAVAADSPFDKDAVLIEIIKALKINVMELQAKNHQALWDRYLDGIFKKGTPMPFENASGEKFMGIIKGVSADGKLMLLLEDDSVRSYGIKEIQMLF